MKNYSNALKSLAWYAFLAVFFVYSVTVGWWLLYPYEPIAVEKPIKIMNPGKVVKAGGTLLYKITYKKKMNVSGVLTRKLVNSYKIDLRESTATAPIGKDADCIPLQVPHYADAGTYYLWWSVEYQVNPLRKITVSVESERFEVVK